MADEIRIYDELRAAEYRTHIRMVKHTSERAVCTMELIDERDRVCLAIDGFHLKRIAAADLAKSIKSASARAGGPATQPLAPGRPLPTSPAPVSPRATGPAERNLVAVIGMSGRFPGCESVREYWDKLASGTDLITEVPSDRWSAKAYFDPDRTVRNKTYSKWGGFLAGIDRFDAAFLQISGNESELSDNEHRLFLEECWQTIEDAGYSDKELSGSRCGVFVGSAKGDYQLKLHHEDGAAIEAQSFPGNETSVLAARISYFMNLKGPAVAVNTACSSSLVSIHMAVQSILSGECDLAIAGGVHICTTPLFYILTSKSGMLSPTGRCHAFGAEADGFVPGEAAAAMLLKPLDRAIEDGDHIYGVIRGSGMNQDGKTNGMTAPSALSQTELEVSVYQRAGIRADSINYIETHGTGTKLGDPIEIDALTNAFRKDTPEKQYCPIGSVKTNMGHAARAAGIASAVKVLMALSNRKIPPSLHCETENPLIKFADSPFFVNKRLIDWKPANGGVRRAAISSFGISGTNCHIVIDEAPTSETRSVPAQSHRYPIALSAKTPAALGQRLQDLAAWFAQPGNASAALQDVSFTLLVGRAHFEHRIAWTVSGSAELAAILGHVREHGSLPPEIEAATSRKVKKQRDVEKGIPARVRELLTKRGDAAGYGAALRELVLLHLDGYDVDWRSLFSGDRVRRLSLPGYPFVRNRYWVPTENRAPIEGRIQGSTRVEVRSTRTVLDGVDPRRSLGEGTVFYKDLSPSDPMVAAHVFEGSPLLPGVAGIEMALAAVEQASGEPCRLLRCTWTRALQVQVETRVEVAVCKAVADRFAFRVYARREGVEETVFQGEAERRAPSDASEAAARVDLEKVKARCARRYERAGLYGAARPGVAYGELLRVIQNSWVGDTEALAELAQGVESTDESLRRGALLDGAMQPLRLFAGDDLRDLRPFRVGKVEIHRPLGARAFSHVRKLGGDRYEVALLDDQGNVTAVLSDLIVREHRAVKGMGRESGERGFYKPEWRRVEPRASGPASEAALVVTCGDVELTRSIVRTLQPANVIVADPQTDATSWASLIGGLRRPTDIYFLAGLSGDSEISPTALERTQRSGWESLREIISALDRGRGVAGGHRLKVLTNNNYRISGNERLIPYSASLTGLAKVAAKEYPELPISICDLDWHEDWSKSTSPGVAVSCWEPEFAVRAGAAYRRVLAPITMARPIAAQFRIGGTYTIIGGAGGLGFTLARYLAKKYRAHLALLGRSPADATHEAKVREIESLGGRAAYFNCDVADAPALQRVFAEIRRTLGPMAGVVHSALTLRDRALANMTREDFAAAMRPKADGAIALYETVKAIPLDFVLFFGSGQSYTCFSGQSNYAAGCTFGDCISLRMNGDLPFPVKTINWGYWGTVGVVANESVANRLRAIGVESIAPEEGLDAVERCLASDIPQVTFMKAKGRLLEAIGVELAPGDDPNLASPKPKADRPSAITSPADVHGPDAAAPRLAHGLEKYVRDVFARVLKNDANSFEREAGFDIYGVDSLVMMDIIRQFEVDLGPLPSTLLFENPNIATVAAYLAEKHADRAAALVSRPAGAGNEPSMQNAGATREPAAAASGNGSIAHLSSKRRENGSPGLAETHSASDPRSLLMTEAQMDDILARYLKNKK